ncbi:hypothetical protein [Spirochaeta isovalerica]|uniref:Lipoprotein n=1 Tax=Spirochaeta isovalerica TaxID=150 RepID=A0A841R9K2_9SPIO|nr:hypothetical protein [Spirochaeta isovalerica]MBB6480585.1 hypothetical protein [Spirochaeta isovalerica]
MKNKYSLLILTISILAFASCQMQGELLDPESTAESLIGMRSILSGMETMMALAVESDESIDYARTIDPYSENADIAEHLQDGSGNPLSPSTVYANFGGTGSNEVRVPSTGYFDDYYTSGIQAYFSISRETADHYRIRLFVFPRTDFSVKYDYEEYLVDESTALTSWEWENMNDDNEAGKLTTYKTFFADGTVADRTVEWNSVDTNGNDFADEGYDAFTVSSDITGSGDYSYPDTVAEPSKLSDDDTVTWSSHTVSEISANNTKVEEFYTESGSDFSGIVYSSKERWGTDKLTVTRYEGNSAAGTLISRSLSTTGNAWDTWETETEVIEKGLSGDRTTYSSTYDVWWADPSEISGNSSYRQVLNLTETNVDSNSYSGTMTEYWGSIGGSFNIYLINNDNGTYTLNRSGWAFASRSAADSDLSVVVDQRDDLSFTVNVGAGTFSGNYIQGALAGTYSEGGSSLEVTIDSSGITAGGVNYKYSELAD